MLSLPHDARVALLRGVAALRALPEGSLHRLAWASTRRALRRGQPIVRQGASGGPLAIVLEGRLDVQAEVGGRRMLLRTLRRGDAVGLSLVAGAPASASVVGGESGTSVLEVPAREVRAQLVSHPESALAAIASLAGLVDALTSELVEARTLPLEERVLRLVHRLGEGRAEVLATQAELADALGASRERVNGALASLEARGFLRRARGRVRLLRARGAP